ncbi:Histone deacetylase complex subunit [Rhodotorula kratochvilovae]
MSPPTSSNNKKGAHRSNSGSSASKKASSAKPTSAGGGSSKSASGGAGKRSASVALADDDFGGAGSKRAKRSASGKKSLREDELGVGAELAEEDMLEAQEGDGAQDEDDDDEGEEGDGGVTRCVCGEDNEEMASGLMIQCDTCKCWQHGPCVGLWDEKECPNRYFCELCKPNLHGPGGLLRKVNRKSSAPARGRSPSAGLSSSSKHAAPSSSHAPAPAHTHAHAHAHNKPRESADAALVHAFLDHAAGGAATGPGGEPKKRSTMNSRDATYDDAIALSILGPGSAAMRARLEKSRGGSGSESGGESEDEVVEEVIVGPGRGKKKGGGSAKGAKKGGAGAGAKRGAKGKSAPPRGRRSHSNSNPEADSPAPQDAVDVEPKLEGAEGEPIAGIAEEEGGEPAAVLDGEGGEGKEEEGEMGPPGKRRRLSPDEMEEGERKEEGVEESQKTELSVATAAQEEPVVEPEARSPSPQPSPVQHHGGARAKHPNQYTYRPKNGQPAPTRAPKSPVKRSHAAAASSVPEPNSKGAAAFGASGSNAVTTTFGWGMPEHLKHLAYLLPSQSPQPLVVTSAVDPSLPSVAEPSTKVRFPGKRVTMPEMRKRARTVLDFVTKVQLEMSERERRWDVLRDVNARIREARERDQVRRAAEGTSSSSGAGSGEGSAVGGSRASSVVGHPRGVGGTTPVPLASTSAAALPDLALGALPPLPGASAAAGGAVELSSAPSAESAALMDALAKEVVQFQQRFFGIVE